MPQWRVTMDVDELIEADTPEQAIETAGGMKGGWHWQAVDPERTEEQQFLVRAVLVRVPDAVRILGYVAQWDNGWFYDHYNVNAVRPDGSTVLCEWDVDHPLHEELNGALTELSNRDGPLDASDVLEVHVTDEQRALVLCEACAAVIEPDGWDDADTPIWSERINDGWSDAICPMGGTHVPVGGRGRAGAEHH